MTVGKIQLAEAAKAVVPSLTTEQSLQIAERQLRIVRKAESHDLRKARWLRKQIGQQLGKAGATIHQLRGEVALLRAQKASLIATGIQDLIQEAVINAVPLFVDGGAVQPNGQQAIGTADVGETLVEEVDLGEDLKAAQQ